MSACAEVVHAACTGKKARPSQRQTRHSLSNISVSTSASTSTVEDPNATLDVSDVSDVEEDDAVVGASDSDADVASSSPAKGGGACPFKQPHIPQFMTPNLSYDCNKSHDRKCVM